MMDWTAFPLLFFFLKREREMFWGYQVGGIEWMYRYSSVALLTISDQKVKEDQQMEISRTDQWNTKATQDKEGMG